MHDIKIGAIISSHDIGNVITTLGSYGFESFAISFWENVGDCDFTALAAEAKEALQKTGGVISCLSFFGNPLLDDEKGEKARNGWRKLIEAAELFDTDLVTGFAGRLVGQPVDASIPVFKKVFTNLTREAAKKSVRLAFENCEMGGNWHSGDWNIAFCPKAWELMFEAVPAENLGLQWEPCHQMMQLIDPIPQLRKWVKRIFSVHGKDGTVAWDIIREKGTHSGEAFAWNRTPGFGDCNWTDIISILRMNGYKGSIDIEGYHDPVYRKELEFTGQLHALRYLKNCRGGDYVPHPLH
jgi:sugar phosphate isomerase/epimerase